LGMNYSWVVVALAAKTRRSRPAGFPILHPFFNPMLSILVQQGVLMKR
jgi:hypothetical protein